MKASGYDSYSDDSKGKLGNQRESSIRRIISDHV